MREGSGLHWGADCLPFVRWAPRCKVFGSGNGYSAGSLVEGDVRIIAFDCLALGLPVDWEFRNEGHAVQLPGDVARFKV